MSSDRAWTPARDASIRLPDGRALGFAEWGDMKGRPVFLFHGMPGSRVFFPDPDAALEECVRAITVDRPGMGRSDPQPGHRVADWPADVVALADALSLKRFGVVGWSAGTPYAFACAAMIPERLTGAAATTSAASLRYLFDEDAKLREGLIDNDERAILEILPQARDAAERLSAADAAEWVRGFAEQPEDVAERSDPGDEWFLEDPDRKTAFIESFREAVCQGSEAMAPQFVAQVSLGLPLGGHHDAGPPVGRAHDGITPPDLMRRVAEKIPQHTFTVWEDVGHVGLAKHLRDVLREL